MQYIVHKRFKGHAICGDVNLPAMTICEKVEGMLMLNGKPVCAAISENAHQYFARDDDGNGIKRGNLTQRIIKLLSKKDGLYQKRWDKVWADPLCQKYKMKEFANHWLWNHAFYNAAIENLVYIANLIGA